MQSISRGAAGLGEFRIRDLNDELNKLMGARFHWERRIMELGACMCTVLSFTTPGGPNYAGGGGPKLMNDSGQEVPGQRGYRCATCQSIHHFIH